MYQAETFFPNFAGTPAGYRRVGLRLPSGIPVAPIVKLESDWLVSVFVDEATTATFCIATSPDNTGLAIVRWLDGHVQTRLDCADVAAQQAALNGKDATVNTHEELVEEAKAGLTQGDVPVSAPAPVVNLQVAAPDEPVPDRGDGKPGRTKLKNYRFRQQDAGGQTRTVIDCHTKLVEHCLVTSSSEANLVAAFRNGNDMLFLFDEDPNYLLESAALVGFQKKRLEATSPKASHTGQTPQQVVEALLPNLAPGA